MSDLSAHLSRLKTLAAKATPGPYYRAPDDASDTVEHENSGLAMVETGRQDDWPIARLCEHPTADYLAACSPDVIAALVAVTEAVEELGVAAQVNDVKTVADLQACLDRYRVTATLERLAEVLGSRG